MPRVLCFPLMAFCSELSGLGGARSSGGERGDCIYYASIADNLSQPCASTVWCFFFRFPSDSPAAHNASEHRSIKIQSQTQTLNSSSNCSNNLHIMSHALALIVAVLVTLQLVAAFSQMRTFASHNGVLDVIVVARPMPGVFNFPKEGVDSKVWTYVTCRRLYKNQMDCPIMSFWPYGTLLQIEPGDEVRVRLVNQLPGKRTNIHFHGLVVNAGFENNFTTFGDYAFVTSYNPEFEKNVTDEVFPMFLKRSYIDYVFPIPKKHPYGLFWFHTHNMQHAGFTGIPDEGNLIMLDYGLSGAMSIGNLKQYVTNIENTPQSTLLFRTTFYDANHTLMGITPPNFCNHTDPLPGYCLGVGRNVGNIEYFTLSGQVYPELKVGKDGAIWRMVQSMSQTVMQISIVGKHTGEVIPFQVLWLDGTSQKSNPGKLVESFFFMPGSRIDIYVPPRADDDEAYLLGTGPTHGFDETNLYPNVYFASIKFSCNGNKPNPKRPVAFSSGGVLGSTEVKERTDISCAGFPPLAPGHRRRISYGNDPNNFILFQLAYAEIDANGNVVNGTDTGLHSFDPSFMPICVNVGVTEVWEIINTTDDDHNFHIHQTKFKVLEMPDIRPGFKAPDDLVDSIPLRFKEKTVVEIPFVITGDIPIHCHLTFHSDKGMMMRVRVAPLAPAVDELPASSEHHH